ncbi:uncharacterized protein LOC116617052 [Nematostella vectensis]|uniref:uncharacterized protein LOC116617052 n=1 Tax=Nematostella vectensis TaxID=45351 RepID=UPI0020771E6A|nr:uncharacterized protein LOC116617052 [Nematostella vectensis]
MREGSVERSRQEVVDHYLSDVLLYKSSLLRDLPDLGNKQAFPVLESGGGYQLLLYHRSCPDRGFHKLEALNSVGRLKSLACKCTIYIRPLQVDILKLALSGQPTTVQQPSPSVRCLKCFEEMPMDMLKEHRQLKRKAQETLTTMEGLHTLSVTLIRLVSRQMRNMHIVSGWSTTSIPQAEKTTVPSPRLKK